jgi:hypothetical protein
LWNLINLTKCLAENLPNLWATIWSINIFGYIKVIFEELLNLTFH